MNAKRKAYLTESLRKLENNSFDENDVRLLLIEIRDLLEGESFLREVCDFVAHPDRNKGICHSRINSRHAKMKFQKDGIQKLMKDEVFETNKDKPLEFFSDQILDYIKTPKMERMLFEVVIKGGIEEIPDHLFLKFYNLTGPEVSDLITKSYIKRDGYYILSESIKDQSYLFIDDLLKFIRGTITGDSIFNQDDLEYDLREGISRIIEKEAIAINLDQIKGNLESVILCIVSILHEANFSLFDNSIAQSFLTIHPKGLLNGKEELLISLNAGADNFKFPVITTNLKAIDYIEADILEIQHYIGKDIPWNIARRNKDMVLQLCKS